MKKLFVVLITFVFFTTTISVQAQNIIKHFNNAMNENIDYMIPTNEYVLSGNTYPPTISGMNNVGPSTTVSRIQLQVIDDQLNTIWFKTYCTQNEVNDYQNSICPNLNVFFTAGDAKQTSDEGFIICGRVRVDGETSGCSFAPTYDDLFLLKTDASGAVQWYRRYDDPAMQFGMLNSVIEASNGNFITCGYQNYGSMQWGVIIGVDANGGLLWSNYAVTPAYWDPSVTVPSEYFEITSYQNDYALVGIANTFGGVWGATLITVIDANGNYIADNIVDNQRYGYVIVGHGIDDADDGDVVITGAAGTPCQGGSHVMILKINPVTLAQNFFKIFENPSSGFSTWGHSIITLNSVGGLFCVTGQTDEYGGGLYVETDYNGNLLRYVPYGANDAAQGRSIVANTAGAFPTFTGIHLNAPEPTFVIRNNYGYDCPSDISKPEYDTPLDNYPSDHIYPPIAEIDEPVVDYDLQPDENVVCGQLKNGTTTVAKIPEGKNIGLYPNPATSTLNITMSNTLANSTLKVYDMTGKEVLSQHISSKTTTINIATLPAGNYILKITNTQGFSERAIFTKE
ncbi:MAG: T9SS type A sorting domain-containing protein [Chitinophagales bacterium]|nr:T9SS type A sorting domain-containing protein [Chitinophagales bacterium]